MKSADMCDNVNKMSIYMSQWDDDVLEMCDGGDRRLVQTCYNE